MRMSIFSESNSMAASALASSVLPTPVGPRNRKLEPAGAVRRGKAGWVGERRAALGSEKCGCKGAQL